MLCTTSLVSPSLKYSKNKELHDSRKQSGWAWRLRLLLSSSLLSVLCLIGFAQAQQTPSCTYNGAAATDGLATDCATLLESKDTLRGTAAPELGGYPRYERLGGRRDRGGVATGDMPGAGRDGS